MMGQDVFLSHLQEHIQAASREDALQPFREKSWSHFQAMGLASKKDPAFRYVPLRGLYQERFHPEPFQAGSLPSLESILHPSCKHSHLVFLNGCFSSELTDLSALPSSVVVTSLEKGLSSHGGFLRKVLERAIQMGQDPFALLNLSLSREGVFVYIPPRQQIEIPLQIIHLVTATSPRILAPRLQLVVGDRSCLRCLVSSHQTSALVAHFSIPVFELFLEAQAEVHLSHSLSSAWLMQSLYASLKRQARLTSVHLERGSISARQNYHIELKEEGAEAHLNGLAMLEGAHTAHTHVCIEHQSPHTHSMQLFKGVLRDLSHSSFSGKIYVHPQAQKTEAYQLNKTLLLSPHAVVSSEPNLEIGADDVKASHGSTVAQLDEQQLLYLQMRGIDKKMASELLVKGFCQEILAKLHPEWTLLY